VVVHPHIRFVTIVVEGQAKLFGLDNACKLNRGGKRSQPHGAFTMARNLHLVTNKKNHGFTTSRTCTVVVMFQKKTRYSTMQLYKSTRTAASHKRCSESVMHADLHP
jgi:hypothetical protein